MEKLLITSLLGFSGGVIFRSFYNFGWSFAIFFIFIGALLAAIFFSQRLIGLGLKNYKAPIFLMSLFLFAFGLGVIRYEIKDAGNNFPLLEKQINSKVVLRGMIVDEPDERENYLQLTIKAEDSGAKILIRTNRYGIFRYGDAVEIKGILKKPEIFSDSTFDWPAYLAKDDIYFEMFYPDVKILSTGGGFWLKRQMFFLKEKFIGNLSSLVPEPNASYLAGLVVGGKKAMPKNLQDEFRRAGIIHVVVLSGYNVTIVADMIMKILSGLPFFFGLGFGILGILLFAVMTGASATVIRASIMAGFVLLARATGRIYHISIALLAAGFLMILANPKILRFDVSFQLSFLATLALICLSPILEKKLNFIPKKFHIREIMAATISTQIFVLPLLLYSTGLFSAVGLVVNLLVLVFIPATMLFGFLSAGLGFLSLALGTPFGWIAYAFSAYELWVVDIFSKLPFASFNISISFWLMLFIYAAYAIVLYSLNNDRRALDKK